MEGHNAEDDRRLTVPQYLFRRLIHVSQCFVVIYYLFPGTVLHLPKEVLFVLLYGGVPLLIESVRIRKGSTIFGQRPHEVKRIGSYAWGLWASMLIILFLPQTVAIPVIITYALVDPLLGELRPLNRWLAPALGWGSAFLLFFAFGYHPSVAAYAAVFMLMGEATELLGRLRLRPDLIRLYSVNEIIQKDPGFEFRTDDNATTQLVPAAALGLVYMLYPGMFPDPWIVPLF